MNKCLRINVLADFPDNFLQGFVQKNARKYDLEGSAQVVEAGRNIVIIICGDSDKMDAFLDDLHKGTAQCVPDSIEIEPFLKEKDYRGVFRIIE